MKISWTAVVLAFAIAAPAVQAQPARNDYSQPNSGWRDQSGAPSRETGYDGRSPRNERAEERQADRREARQDQRQADIRQDRAQLNQDRRRWRDQRRNAQWDQNLHNGYYRNNGQWRYGQPNA
jgi:hypothetical protein